MSDIETDVRAWLGSGRTIRGLPSHDNGGAGLVRALLESFQESYPAHTEQMSVLETMARICGYADVSPMLGNAICKRDGGLTLSLNVA